MKKTTTILVALLLFAPKIIGENNIISANGIYEYSNGSNSLRGDYELDTTIVLDEASVVNKNGIYKYLSGGESLGTPIQINAEIEATVILDGVTIDMASTYTTGKHTFRILKGASVNLILRGDNRLKGGKNFAAIEVHEGASLTISGEGKLTAIGGEGAAGIGGGFGPESVTNSSSTWKSGDITINSGTIIAKGGDLASGIGAGINNGSSGTITINGGTIDAEGGNFAGIGGSYRYISGGNSIIINGGHITASGGSEAGIGAGDPITAPTIKITGGTIESTFSHPPTNWNMTILRPVMLSVSPAWQGNSSLSDYHLVGKSAYSLKDAKTDDKGVAHVWLPTGIYAPGEIVLNKIGEKVYYSNSNIARVEDDASIILEIRTGISNVEKSVKIYSSGKTIYIDTPISEQISVYTTTGVLLNRFEKPAGKSTIEALAPIVIIKGNSGWVKKLVAGN
ncbi:MAG: hypothetical protein LBF08_01110 [Dysgonamonadaceae bacterium]|jgi:hypothetical protein|nr:hypothetical protein [Dysgonamonadaceae bacterium]